MPHTAMKVAISGVGVAGPALAYWLHRLSHMPTLIEQAPALRRGGYMIDFWGVGYRVAQRMGIESAICEAGYQVQALRTVDRQGHTCVSLATDGFPRITGGKFTSLPRSDLSAAIYATIADHVETIFGDSIAALDECDAGVRVAFEHSAGRDFDLVIGADGLHSAVRRLAFGPEQAFERCLGYRVAACVVEGYRPRDELVAVIHHLPGRQVVRLSLRDDRTLFLFVFLSDASCDPFVPGDIGSRKALLHGEFGDGGWECPHILAAMDSVDELYFDNVSQIHMDCWSQGRVLLIGDAAACVSLLAGEGSGLAVTEAYVLAGELHRAGSDHRRAFAAYETRMRPFIEGKQKSAEKFASSFTPRSRFGIWVRIQAMRAMRFDALARLFVGRTLRDDFDLPDYGI